jgi:hypothetical protein
MSVNLKIANHLISSHFTSFTRQNSIFTACVASVCRMYRELEGVVEGVEGDLWWCKNAELFEF